MEKGEENLGSCMRQLYTVKRWYDKDPIITEAIRLIRKLPVPQQEQLAQSVINFVNLLRKNRNEDPETLISIGKDRVLGLYKSSNCNRWYDKTPMLQIALKKVSSLPDEDAQKVAQGIIDTLSSIEQ